jgi:hypothetical protein
MEASYRGSRYPSSAYAAFVVEVERHMETDEVGENYYATADAEAEAFEAICSYRCRTPEDLKAKAEYLLTTSTVKDNWDDDAKALLEAGA